MIVLVVGTGTDVGKTHVSRALALAGAMTAWKPVTSGGLEDVERLSAEPPLYALRDPISPHLAARREGVVLQAAAIAEEALRREARASALLVETAGGLYSPLSETETNADVARVLAGRARELAIVLVAPDRLGVLHDVGATVRAARADGLELAALVLSAPERPDASTGTNGDELVRLGLAPAVVTFPRAEASGPVSLERARAVLASLVRGGSAARSRAAERP